jgi:hypothetical protein
MADLTGAHTTLFPVISQNTESILRHKARFVSSLANVPIVLPLADGLRYIIYSAITAGTTFSIGVSTNGSTIISGRTLFTFAQGAGPIDLTRFFSATPFTQYIKPNSTDVFLLITSNGPFMISVVEYKV